MNIASGSLSTPDGTIIAYHHYTNNHRFLVVSAHGFYDSKDSALSKKLAKNLAENYDVLCFDFRGHGKSSGLFTWTAKESEDLETVLKYIQGRYVKTGLIGFSMGGSIGINTLASTDIVNSFVCVSAPSDVSRIDYRLWELNPENEIIYSLFTKEGRKGKGVRPGPFWLEKEKPIDSIGKVRVPVMYIHGTNDWLIKPWHSQVLYDKTPTHKKLHMIDGGPHAEYLLLKHDKETLSLIKNWFDETLGEGKAQLPMIEKNKWKIFFRKIADSLSRAAVRIKKAVFRSNS
ncbi:MAG: alpha/beta fold hydrolase [Elusimicrobiota bacterium]